MIINSVSLYQIVSYTKNTNAKMILTQLIHFLLAKQQKIYKKRKFNKRILQIFGNNFRVSMMFEKLLLKKLKK